MSGTGFSRGDAEFSSTLIGKALSGSETVWTAGGLFGPGAAEIGGTVEIDDADLHDLRLYGCVSAD